MQISTVWPVLPHPSAPEHLNFSRFLEQVLKVWSLPEHLVQCPLFQEGWITGLFGLLPRWPEPDLLPELLLLLRPLPPLSGVGVLGRDCLCWPPCLATRKLSPSWSSCSPRVSCLSSPWSMRRSLSLEAVLGVFFLAVFILFLLSLS